MCLLLQVFKVDIILLTEMYIYIYIFIYNVESASHTQVSCLVDLRTFTHKNLHIMRKLFFKNGQVDVLRFIGLFIFFHDKNDLKIALLKLIALFFFQQRLPCRKTICLIMSGKSLP